jgi:hypothetical protein
MFKRVLFAGGVENLRVLKFSNKATPVDLVNFKKSNLGSKFSEFNKLPAVRDIITPY